MKCSLTRASLALAIPIAMAYGPPYPRDPPKWEDIMVAISDYPRFFGEPANVSHTADHPKVDSYANNANPALGSTPLNIYRSGGGKTVIFSGPEKDPNRTFHEVMGWASLTLQEQGLPDFNGLTFRIMQGTKCHRGAGPFTMDCFTSFLQTIPGSPAAIDNTWVELSHFTQCEDALCKSNIVTGVVFPNASDPTSAFKYRLYTGEPDPNPWLKGGSCSMYEARDSAALRAMKQPDWEPLFPAEYNQVHTVQDGQLYLAWVITFKLKGVVGDDFNVWVNARDCRHIIAASSASITDSVLTRDEFVQQQVQLFKDRGIPVKEKISS